MGCLNIHCAREAILWLCTIRQLWRNRLQRAQQKTRFELFCLNTFSPLAYGHVSYTKVALLNHCSLQCRVPFPVVQGCRKDAGSSRRALSACGGNRWGARGRVAMDSRALRRRLAKDCEHCGTKGAERNHGLRLGVVQIHWWGHQRTT